MSGLSSEARGLCEQLAAAARVMLGPLSSREQRLQAFTQCEDFKRAHPLAADCALALAEGSAADPVVRHFGLKLLEDVIKLRWNEMEPANKVQVKEGVMRLMSAGTGDILVEAPHVKDGVSRLVVEMVKREYPQHWPNLLSELEGLCRRGETQTELTMLVLVRLVEDVAVLQTLEQNQRRKEIYQALSANMEAIFAFLLQLLERHYQAYLPAEGDQRERHRRVCKSVVGVFTALVEWVPIQHVMANDKYLLRCLCVLLSDCGLRDSAAECLLGVVTWKAGKPVDRMQLMALFATDMMAPLFRAVEAANALGHSEEHYAFLKKTVQVLAELGAQLTSLWTRREPGSGPTVWEKEVPSGRPDNFEIFLNAILAFLDHPSQVVNHSVAELWAKMLRHNDISRDEVFVTYVPKFVPVAVKKVLKIGQPSMRNHASCQYSQLDFETEEEFSSFFGKFRIILLEAIKLVKADNAVLPYQHAELWLKRTLQKVRDRATSPEWSSSGVCAELDAIAGVLDAVLFRGEDAQLGQVERPAVELVQLCLAEQIQDDHDLASSLLSCISSLFPVVCRPAGISLLVPVLERVFSHASAGNRPIGAKIALEVRTLRRHACALMVKLASRHAAALLPVFPQLRERVTNMRASGMLWPLEFSTMVEALVIVGNERKSYDHQLEFLRAIVEPVWLQITSMEGNMTDAKAFVDFAGLSAPCPDGDEDPAGERRSSVAFCLSFILNVCRRSAVPSDLADCHSGGFVVAVTEAGVALRNPAWPVVSHTLRHVLTLARTVNELYSTTARAHLHPTFADVLDIVPTERANIFGSSPNNKEEREAPKGKKNLSRVQAFVFETYENVQHFLSECCSSCGGEFYETPNLAVDMLASVFKGLDKVPDYRLRSVNRMFLKTLVQKCPKRCYATVLAPVLRAVCPFLLKRLEERWTRLATLREAPGYDEDDSDSKEVMEDVICRHLAREYLDVVKAILTGGGGSDVPASNFGKERNDENDGGGGGQAANGGSRLVMSELGHMALLDESLGQCLTLTALQALLWPDSPSSVRASALLELMLPVLVRAERLGEAEASQIMFNILSAINKLGQHELNSICLIQLAINAYDLMRPRFPSLVQVLAQVPGCNRDDLRRFDERIMQAAQSKEGMKGGERAKKDMFKKLIGQFIGKDVAQMFRHDVIIKNLPTLKLLKAERKKTPSLDETEKGDIGLGALFQNGQGQA